MKTKIPINVDEYISNYPVKVQIILRKIRQTIRSAVPKAEETISYQMPAYKFEGNLIFFAAFKEHIGIYPLPSGINKFKKELSRYASGKGSIKLPLDEPIPYLLIKKIVIYRANENIAKAKRKKKIIASIKRRT
jgi:uncharacterized protein YdhG (YjbR/CyaY superfamily)